MWCSLLDVCHIYGRIGFRGYTKEDLVFSGGAITLSPSNIINGKMSYDNCTYISWAKYEESPEIKVSNNDIVLVKTGSSYGKCALVTELPQAATINPQFVVLKYISCNSELLRYILQSDYAKYNYEKFVLGTAIPTFTQVALGNMLIPLPPLKEQIKIIKEIEKWFAIIDEVENNTIALETYIKQIKSKILDLAISGKLVSQDPTDEPAINLLKRINPNFKPCDNSHYENLPENWIEIPINVICNMYQPQTIATTELNPNGKYLVYGANGIIGKYDYYNHSESEILLTCRGATCGNINISEPYSWINGNAMVMHLKEEYCQFIDRNWFIYFLKSINKDNLITGTAQPQITQVSLKKLHVNLPPLGEQKRIANKISKIWSMIETITAEL